MKTIRARAPVRFCDLGGWTDTRLVPEGWVLNFAATLYTHVTLVVGGGGVTIESCDTEEFERVRHIRELEYNSVLDLVKAAILTHAPQGQPAEGIQLTVRSDAPPASGLGSSAALGVATMAALSHLAGIRRLPYEIARESQALEVEQLRLECGVQDQLAAAYGGVNFMHVRYPEATVFPVPLSDATRCELEDRLMLVYTGKSHFSSGMHQKVIASFESGDPATRGAFDRLADAAMRGKSALLAGDMARFGAAMRDNWQAQKALHPDITTPQVDRLEAEAAAAGAIGFKLNGAGGGGTATILCERNRNHLVRRAVEAAGMHVLPTGIDRTGLETWEPG